jgi:hypothetical protein
VINSALYREPQLLDAVKHRGHKLKAISDLSMTRNMHAVFLTATEFPQAGLEMPIIFINTGERTESGKPMVSPVALLGLSPNENLRVGDDGRWNGRYIPAFIRRFPFLTAGVSGSDQPGVFIDTAWSGFNEQEGEALFDEQGAPTDTLKQVLDFLQRFDDEQRRTRMFCERVVELELLKEMHADATMPDGQSLKVEGFLVVEEDRLHALPDATVIELHRNGILALLHAHLISTGNIRDLVERKAIRVAAARPA